MEPGDKALLREIAEQTADNNRLLRKLVAAQRWAQLLVLLKWVIILGVAFGAYYYLQPLVEQVIETYRALGVSIPDANRLQNLFQGWGQ